MLKLDKTSASIAGLLKRAVFEAQLREPDRQIVLKLEKKLPKPGIDVKRIQQVLDNLISNAVKYSGAGTKIVVSGEMRQQELLISVTDQGVGIPDEELPLIFDRFYRIKQGQVHSKSGAGLGLSISKGLVEQHGGKIWVESKEGEGSTFRFTLPLDTNLKSNRGQ